MNFIKILFNKIKEKNILKKLEKITLKINIKTFFYYVINTVFIFFSSLIYNSLVICLIIYLFFLLFKF